MAYIEVSKLDAAKRQMDLAIKLFFHSADPVSILALSANANNVLRDLAKKQSKKSVIYDEVLEQIRPDKQEEFIQILRESQNFIKHAESDKKTNRLSLLGNEMLIFDNCILYLRLTGELSGLHGLYRFWFFIKNPNIAIEQFQEMLFKANKTFDPEDKFFFWSLLPDIESKLTDAQAKKQKVD